MPAMGWDGYMIARLQMDWPVFPFKQQLGFALEHHHPLGFILIVPEVFGADVAGGHDPFDADVLALNECLNEFCRKLGWKWREQIEGLSIAFLAGQHVDGL
jgi:hypothetical protein